MSESSRGTCNCSIVPPHILEAIALNGTPEQRLAAQQTLAQTEQMRAFRISETARLDGAKSIAPSLETAGPAHKNRRIFNTSHSTTLPGTSARTEGQAATGDAAVNEAY